MLRTTPPPKKNTHTGCGRTGKERLLGAGSRRQNSGRPTDKETLRGASRMMLKRERRGVFVFVSPSLGVCIRVCASVMRALVCCKNVCLQKSFRRIVIDHHVADRNVLT